MKKIQAVISRITLKESLYFVGTFVLIFVAAKLGQYIFFGWKTSPAILWPPTGIGLSILWLGGYRYAVPVFLGLLVASLTGPVAHLIPAVVTTPIAQVLGQVTGAYLLRRFGFNGSFASIKNILLFLGVIIFACMVAPTITTLISFITGNLTTPAYISWSRSWAGYVFSCLILAPLILSWAKSEERDGSRHPLEAIVVGCMLFVSVYLLFWTRSATQFSFIIFATFFLAHLWTSFRFSTRVVAFSMLATTVLGILGIFISPNPERALNTQLFATELFLFLIVPIFYAFSALVKERANTIHDLEIAVGRIEKESIVKNNFISVLAHELRNPLAPVKSTLEILSSQPLDKELLALIQSAHHQVHSMRRLLDDLLDISRVNQGKFELHMIPSDLRTMIEHSIAATQALVEKGHTISLKTPATETPVLLVDPIRFEQALVNILNNASKYTEEGGVIDITYTVDNEVLELRVEDNGIGIAPEDLENVFEPFWQVRNSVLSSTSGIGVGLSLTRHIIELHKGRLYAESNGTRKGSTFVISMPAVLKDVKEKSAQIQQTVNSQSHTILVVDDNHTAADALKKLLTLKGHVAETAYTGLGAIEAVHTFNPDIVLLDIGLPDIDGHEVASRLRAADFGGKIIALSGYGQKEDKEKAIAHGCDYHFTKPVGIAALEEYFLRIDTRSLEEGQ